MPRKRPSPNPRRQPGRRAPHGDAAVSAGSPPAPGAPTSPGAAPRSDAAAGAIPRNHRELAEAIFAQCDPVAVGRDLLESGSERGATVKARVWETLVEFLLGKTAPAPPAHAAAAPVIVWDLPAPPHERHG